MEIPNLKLYGFTDVLDRASMDDKKRYFYVDSHEHIAVVSKLADKILAAQDELIKAYNEIIALKSNIPYQIVQKEPVAQFDGCWAVKRNNEDAKAILTKPDAQFLMDKLGIYYPQALGLLDTGRLTTNNGTELELWKLEAL